MDIADISVVGVKSMQEQSGVTMTTLEFLQALDEATPEDTAGAKCSEIAALLVVLAG
jgi:hypothetical protein